MENERDSPIQLLKIGKRNGMFLRKLLCPQSTNWSAFKTMRSPIFYSFFLDAFMYELFFSDWRNCLPYALSLGRYYADENGLHVTKRFLNSELCIFQVSRLFPTPPLLLLPVDRPEFQERLRNDEYPALRGLPLDSSGHCCWNEGQRDGQRQLRATRNCGSFKNKRRHQTAINTVLFFS